MQVSIGPVGPSEGSFVADVRVAHDHAVKQRKELREKIQQKHSELARIEYEREVLAVDRMVASAMQAAIERGEKRGDIRRSIRTNDNNVWKHYLSLVDNPAVLGKPDPDAGKIVYVTDTGWRWNITDRTVTDPDGETNKIGTIWYEEIDGEEVATVLASKVPGANDNPPSMEERRELMELIRAGEVKPG